jgi:uroporphyrinogen decarboxylase
VNEIVRYLRDRFPAVPVVYFANGGSGYLSRQLDLPVQAWSIDWRLSMQTARAVAGPDRVLAGNVDPLVLYADPHIIRQHVHRCLTEAQGHHVLNLGHGLEKDMREEAVEVFVRAARDFTSLAS